MKITRILIFILLLLGTTAHSQPTKEMLLGKAEVQDTPGWTQHKGMYIQTRTLDAFKKMRRAARWHFINLKIVSAYRSFDRQKYLWERKWDSAERASMGEIERARDILRYSSMPGTSRHHWGSDIDLNSVENEYFETRKGRRIYRWLTTHAPKYGFFQPYTLGRSKGYAEEPWHWSFSAISEGYLDQYLKTISDTDVEGFRGDQTADELDIIEGWVKLD